MHVDLYVIGCILIWCKIIPEPADFLVGISLRMVHQSRHITEVKTLETNNVG